MPLAALLAWLTALLALLVGLLLSAALLLTGLRVRLLLLAGLGAGLPVRLFGFCWLIVKRLGCAP